MFAVLWMFGALASFCLMAIGAREVSGELTTFQILFFRGIVGLLIVSVILLLKKQTIRSSQYPLHFSRNLFHFGGQYGWFLGIGLLPLAEVFALEFTVPIWTIIIAAIFLGETITKQKVLAVFLGLLGVLIIVQPGYAIVDPVSLIVIGAAICYAVSYVLTKSLATSEPPLLILFYMCIIQLPISLIGALYQWNWPDLKQWLWITVVGTGALLAHYCIVRAMNHTEVTTIVTLDFLRLPLIALVGVLFYEEAFEITIIVGGALMLIANLISIGKLIRSKKDNPDDLMR